MNVTETRRGPADVCRATILQDVVPSATQPSPMEGTEAHLDLPRGFPSHLLVVGSFNVCDWDLLKFLSCPPQRALLSWNWGVNAAMRNNVLGKIVLIFFKPKKSVPWVLPVLLPFLNTVLLWLFLELLTLDTSSDVLLEEKRIWSILPVSCCLF